MKFGLGLGVNNGLISGLKDILLAECDNVSDFDYVYSCDKVLDEVNKQSGTGSLKFTKNNTIAGYFSIGITRNLDLSKYSSFKYLFYVANKSNIASVSTTLFTTFPYSYDHAYVNFMGWQINNGWNSFDIPFGDFVKTGAETLTTVKAVRFTINLTVDNQTEVVNFDRVEVLK